MSIFLVDFMLYISYVSFSHYFDLPLLQYPSCKNAMPERPQTLRQTELLFAVEQLFLDKPGQRPDGIAQAAEGADVSAEKPVEQQRETAQPQQGKREAVCREYLARTDVQKDLFYPGKPGHECARHGHKEEQLHPGAFVSGIVWEKYAGIW